MEMKISTLNEVCRGCMSCDDELSDLLLENEVRVTFALCTRLEIVEDDGLPHSICSNCVKQCLAWLSFKRQCEYSETELRKLVETKKLDASAESANEPPDSEPDYNDFQATTYEPVVNALEQDEEEPIQIAQLAPVAASAKKPQKKCVSCPLCGKICRNEDRLEAHKRWHAGLKPEVCKICAKEFVNVRGLRQHGVKHESNGNRHTCNDCGKTYKYKNSLRLHSKIHRSKPRYVCDFCGKSFFRAHGLQSHLLSHSTATPFSCDVCSKQFKTKVMLRNHQSRHDGIKKFVCVECGKMFITSAELRTHGRMHSGIKPFGCDLCDKKYKTKSHLAVHMRSHTGARPYACEFCPLNFAYRRILKQHLLTHTGERPHTCTICGKTFRQRSTMSTHMRVHTKIAGLENGTRHEQLEIIEVTVDDIDEEELTEQIVMFGTIDNRE